MPYFVWPVPGFHRVTSGFMTADRPGHMGIDIGRNVNPPRSIEGAEVVAVADGRASRVVWNHGTSGNMVELDHGGGVVSRYMHNQINMVSQGQHVRQGGVIALVGNTGRSTAPHLHLELLFNGRHVDPSDFLCPERRCPASAGIPVVPPAVVGVTDLPVAPCPSGGKVKAMDAREPSLAAKAVRLLARVFGLR